VCPGDVVGAGLRRRARRPADHQRYAQGQDREQHRRPDERSAARVKKSGHASPYVGSTLVNAPERCHCGAMPWSAPEVDRLEPPTVADERTSLEAWLDYHRQTLLLKCAGLTADQLKRRAVEPSTLSLLGLVRHMAEVERSWFQRRVAGRELPYLFCDVESNPDGDFDDVETADAEADFATFQTEVDEARAVVADRSLEDTFVGRRGNEIDVRWVFVHMIEEYARHNGHADLLRERIDGARGD
jgi:hypothetical protein